MSYLPILFICLAGDLCDFVYAKPVFSKEICETMNAEYELQLDGVDGVVAYRSACIPVNTSEEPGRKTYFL